MKLLIFSDAQYTLNLNKSEVLPNGLTSWLNEQITITKDIFSCAYEKKVDKVIFNGDLFEDRSRISSLLYNVIWSSYYRSPFCGLFIFNVGNHDIYSHNTDLSLAPFSSLGQVINKPFDFEKENTLIRILPYGFLNEQTCQISSTEHKYRLLFTHEIISNLELDNNFTLKNSFDASLLKDWTYVFNGHIHKPQEYMNIINIGSIMPNDWGEEGDQKRFLIYENGIIESIDIDHPRFLTLEDPSKEKLDKISKDNRNYYRLSCKSDDLTHKAFLNFNVSIKEIKSERRKLRLKKTDTINDELIEYLNLNNTDLGKDKLFLVGMELINDMARLGDSSM